ncbi:MAG: lipoate--protein ligase family protein [candidate division KSB1 bacterium]|nr:lipoate--protein ligase family protein [candidate division KSB1 bacterium]MDZ7274058.1 lipoate--protein ligase family protein [candidate division KSB1 bacterium]MDZ7296658.1 lipoate--protein ligase family protein [candidate division KSB1 bacterium]MDZ7307275.1 lipoate--protein ligase family protein [candidate division KSB1 bacterium]MDZ7347524.1 lipoate--protein ligase family protein [candidate division KSB1 bacterium]
MPSSADSDGSTAKNSTPIRLLNLGLTESWRTQAVYHAVAELMHAEAPDTIIICRPQTPYLCLGYHQVFDATFDRAECVRRNLPVFRRRLGGGATYLDANQLFYQCVFHHRRVPVLLKALYQRMLAAPVAALRRLGLNAALCDLNEIEVAGKRIAGTGSGRLGEAAVVVGNFLFDFDYETMGRVWRVPGESFRLLALEAMKDRLVTLRQLGSFAVAAVEKILVEEFERTLGRPVLSGRLTAVEEARSRELAAQLTSPAYLNLHRGHGEVEPQQELKISANVFIRAAQTVCNGHVMWASVRVDHNCVAVARLDSQPPQNWQKHEAAMAGMPFQGWQNFWESFFQVAAAIPPAGCNMVA